MNSITRITIRLLLIIAAAVCGSAFAADPQPTLNPHLEPLRPLLGTTWKGVIKDSKPDKPMTDIARWERALNGQAVRMLHSINNGFYGGETILLWDEKAKAIVYYYFTTEGAMSKGTLTPKGEGKFVSEEEVLNAQDNVSKVRANTEVQRDKMHVKAEYLKANEWKPGHEITYVPEKSAEVVFK